MDSIIQRSVITQLSRRPEVVEVGPFVIGCDPTTTSRFITYATPRLDAVVQPADVAELVAAFARLDRVPRLEYVTSCAPTLERQLLDAGFAIEARHDYLVCSAESRIVPATPAGYELVEPTTDEQRAALIAAQSEAFGENPTATDADVARIRRMQDSGAVAVLARADDGSCVGGGVATAPAAGASEVAGIAVREPFRGLGIGGALTAAITTRVLAGDADVAWLEASGEQSWRVYERVGYAPAGKRLYIALD